MKNIIIICPCDTAHRVIIPEPGLTTQFNCGNILFSITNTEQSKRKSNANPKNPQTKN